MTDIPAMLSLINGYAAEGVMLPRTEFELSECIRDFTVIYDDVLNKYTIKNTVNAFELTIKTDEFRTNMK